MVKWIISIKDYPILIFYSLCWGENHFDIKAEILVLREQIDKLDKELLAIFKRRMLIVEKIAEVKALGKLAVNDAEREKQVLEAAAALFEGDKWETLTFMNNVMTIAKTKQYDRMLPSGEIFIPPVFALKTEDLNVAYLENNKSGSEQVAAEMFPASARSAYDDVEGVMEATKTGKADFGILPIENSQKGVFGEVYELIGKNGVYIVAQSWVNTEDIRRKNRFVVIAARAWYDLDCDITSVSFSAAYKSKAIALTLQVLMLAGIDAVRIGSKCLSTNRYLVFADLQTNLLNEGVKEALNQAAKYGDDFQILGCYRTWAEKEKIVFS